MRNAKLDLRTKRKRVAGTAIALAGLVLGSAILLAGKQIGDLVWAARGYPFDLGPELFFWGNRGLVLALILFIVGMELLLSTKRKPPSD